VSPSEVDLPGPARDRQSDQPVALADHRSLAEPANRSSGRSARDRPVGVEPERERCRVREPIDQSCRETVGRNHVEAHARKQGRARRGRLVVPIREIREHVELTGHVQVVGSRL